MAQIKYTDRGQMRHFVSFLDPGTEPDADGKMLAEPIPVDGLTNIPASVESLSGAELRKAESITSEVTTRIIIPWYPGVESRLIVSLTTRSGATKQFEILAVMDPDNLEVELRLLCVERT